MAVEQRRRRDGRVVRLGSNQPVAVRELTDAQVRAWAVELAADMEMGYYVSPEGVQWEARPFVIRQLKRHMGYGESDIESNVHPAWWPGLDTLRRLVTLKVLVRRAQSAASSGAAPWIDAAAAAAAEELLRRLLVEPEKMHGRELVDLTTKLARLAEERRSRGYGAVPAGAKAVKSRTFERITETIAEFEDPEERARFTADYERAVDAARAAIPAVSAEVTE